MPSDAFVKLSFNYYDDIVLASLDDAAEVMFTRGMAFCGRTGSGGFIPRNKVLDLSRKTNLGAALKVADRLCSQVNGFSGPWKKVAGGYMVRNFAHYQEQLDAIQQRRKNDRDRKARERAMSRDSSRDVSRDSHGDVTHTSKRKKKKEEETPKGVSNAHDLDHAFEQFWAAYPRKVGRGQARRAFDTAAKKADPAVLVAAAVDFAQWCAAEETEPRYIAHPTTWLNGERWLDERPAHQPAQTNIDKHLQLVTDLAEREAHDEPRQIGPA
jgi:hypothetical protein